MPAGVIILWRLFSSMQQSTLQWHIGCSGFHYKEWEKLFYPEGMSPKNWFAWYCEHFSALELNVSFYRFPELSSLQNWYRNSPGNFYFSVKAPRLITHYKKFENTKQLLDDFYNVVEKGLNNKLGCVLFQLPPQLEYSEQLLAGMLSQMNNAFTNVIEFRHSSWWRPEVYATLSQNNICFCSISYPHLSEQLVVTTGVVYYRFHGVPQLYASSYSKSFLQQVVSGTRRQPEVKQAFLFFNNTARAAAVRDARYLQKSLSG